MTISSTPDSRLCRFLTYGLFLLVLPLYRLGAKPPALIAAGWALVAPQLLYLLQPVVGGRSFLIVGQAEGLVSLFFTGGCPPLTWVPFVIAGMPVARLDLAATAVPIRLALAGVGYGGSWQALRLVSGAAAAVREAKQDRRCRPCRPAASASSAPPAGCRPPARWRVRPWPGRHRRGASGLGADVGRCCWCRSQRTSPWARGIRAAPD